MKTLFILSIGHYAANIIADQKSAIVCGVTSKGAFLSTPPKEILFITSHCFRGPVTINLSKDESILHSLPQSTKVVLSENEIFILEQDCRIQLTDETQIWYPPEISQPLSIPHLRVRSMEMQRVVDGLENNPFPQSIYNPDAPIPLGNTDTLINFFSDIIGQGTGLTPTADDFLCGFLLAAHALYKTVVPGFSYQKFAIRICQTAREKTTSLSATLISCASQGSADERIINCIAWLQAGEGTMEKIIKELRSYGSSSGIDTLRGSLAFINAVLD